MIPALLVLEDGSVFRGESIGREGEALGEVVCNSSMTGYQEIISSPDYKHLLVSLSTVHMGNVGANPLDEESRRNHAAGVIVRNHAAQASSWRSHEDFDTYLKRQGVVGIGQVDTRALTLLLRDKGTLKGVIASGAHDDAAVTKLVAKAKSFSGLAGADLVASVSTEQSYKVDEGSYAIDQHAYRKVTTNSGKALVIDFGVKKSLLGFLVDKGLSVNVVPASMPLADVLAQSPDMIVLSNGPGDPCASAQAQALVKALLQQDVPLFGVGFGMQLLALAAGCKVLKMHRGAYSSNYPVKQTSSGKVSITHQSHAFAVDRESLAACLELTHTSLFDGGVQGIAVRGKAQMGLQADVASSGDPRDISYQFDEFARLVKERA